MNDASNEARQDARARAILADLTSGGEIKLCTLWCELTCGAGHIVDSFFTEDRGYLLLATAQSPERALADRRLAILEGVLCGLGQKRVAIDLDLAPSTVAINAKIGLRALGLGCTPSRVPPLVMLAAQASRDNDRESSARLSVVVDQGVAYRVVGAPRPDRLLARVLPPAELAVVRILVEGECYSEIARRRGTSARTIANQLAAAFRRVGVSGRGELLHRLITGKSLAPRPATVRPRPRPLSARAM